MNASAHLDSTEWVVLGLAIRERRRARGLTLVNLAQMVGLSQPFLSQVENGKARPSMTSLYRIAHTLDTTPQALFGGSVDPTSSSTPVRAQQVRSIDFDGRKHESIVHLLLAGDAPFHVLEFAGLPAEFADYWEHDGYEAVYVIEGDVEIDLAGAVTQLNSGDFHSYPSDVPHRLRSPDGKPARVLLIETRVGATQGRLSATHDARSTTRKRPARDLAGSRTTATGKVVSNRKP